MKGNKFLKMKSLFNSGKSSKFWLLTLFQIINSKYNEISTEYSLKIILFFNYNFQIT